MHSAIAEKATSGRQRQRALLSRPGPRLFLTSAALLFVELLLIRWIPAEVTYVGFFSNFLLIGCFVGTGVGILLGRGTRLAATRPTAFAFALLALVVLVVKAKLNVQIMGSSCSVDLIRLSRRSGRKALVNLVNIVRRRLDPISRSPHYLPPLDDLDHDVMGFGMSSVSHLRGSAWYLDVTRLADTNGATEPLYWGSQINPQDESDRAVLERYQERTAPIWRQLRQRCWRDGPDWSH